MNNYSRLFSSHMAVASTDRERADEVKCYYLHHHLTAIKSAYEQVYDDVADTVFCQFLAVFEQVLITNGRTQAILVGEAFLFQGFRKLKGCLDDDHYTILLAEAGITLDPKIDSVSFGTNYVKCKDVLDAVVNTAYCALQHQRIFDIVIALAKCKSFHYLKLIIDKLSPEALPLLLAALDQAFYSALRFGDEEMVGYLLHHGVNPNERQYLFSDKKQLPLSLVIGDLTRFLYRMNELVCLQRQSQLTVGDLADLEFAMKSRLQSYKMIIEELLSQGADPDKIPDESFVDRITPRALAMHLISAGVPQLEKCDACVSNHIETITQLLLLIYHAPALSRQHENLEMEARSKKPKC